MILDPYFLLAQTISILGVSHLKNIHCDVLSDLDKTTDLQSFQNLEPTLDFQLAQFSPTIWMKILYKSNLEIILL